MLRTIKSKWRCEICRTYEAEPDHVYGAVFAASSCAAQPMDVSAQEFVEDLAALVGFCATYRRPGGRLLQQCIFTTASCGCALLVEHSQVVRGIS